MGEKPSPLGKDFNFDFVCMIEAQSGKGTAVAEPQSLKPFIKDPEPDKVLSQTWQLGISYCHSVLDTESKNI